jgi:hypothetical protein
MATIKDLVTYDKFKSQCEFCGYKEYPICLTAHHLFPKDFFKPQPDFDREDRYIVLCPNCHVLLHKGILVNKGKQIILGKIENCQIKYKTYPNIDKIIQLAKLVYERAYK